MSRFLKFLEIIFFVFINILFSFSFVALSIVFLMVFFWNRLIIPEVITNNDINSMESIMLFIAFFSWLLYVILKIILFPILYEADKKFPNIHKFLDLFYSKKILNLSIFIIALFIPIIECIIFSMINEIRNPVFSNMPFQFMMGYGVLPSYLIMYFYMKVFAKNNLK